MTVLANLSRREESQRHNRQRRIHLLMMNINEVFQ